MQAWEEIAYAKLDGIEEGRNEGRNEKAKEAATKMMAAGVSTENISEWLGLSEEEVLKL